MFRGTDTAAAPWTVVRSNDKKRGRIAALRWVLSTLDYPTKDEDAVSTPDPLIVGPPDQVYEQSEREHRPADAWAAMNARHHGSDLPRSSRAGIPGRLWT
jgi:hypothetical protein